MPSVSIGSMRDRVTIVKRSATILSNGERRQDEYILASVYARVKQITGDENNATHQNIVTQNYEVTIRYLNELDASCIVIYNNKRLEIVSVVDSDQMNRFQVLSCVLAVK